MSSGELKELRTQVGNSIYPTALVKDDWERLFARIVIIEMENTRLRQVADAAAQVLKWRLGQLPLPSGYEGNDWSRLARSLDAVPGWKPLDPAFVTPE